MPAASHFGVNRPQAWRFQALFDQSEKTSAPPAAGDGIAAGVLNRVGDAGAMRKSLSGMLFAAVDSVALRSSTVPAALCCAQSGKASQAPTARIAHHLRIVSSMNDLKVPRVPARKSLIVSSVALKDLSQDGT